MKINQVVTENLADQFAAMARARGMNVRIAGTPEQERERSRQRMAQRDAERTQADSDAAQADLAQLPELKAKYEQMKDEYDSLGGNNWQYADREQNLTDRERQARAMEHELNSLGNRIARAEKSQGAAKDDVKEGVGGTIAGAVGGGIIGSLIGHPWAGTALGAWLGSWLSKSNNTASDDNVYNYKVYVNGQEFDPEFNGTDEWLDYDERGGFLSKEQAVRAIIAAAEKEHDRKTQYTIVNGRTGQVVFRKYWSDQEDYEQGLEPGWQDIEHKEIKPPAVNPAPQRIEPTLDSPPNIPRPSVAPPKTSGPADFSKRGFTGYKKPGDVDEGFRVANQQIPGTHNRAKSAYYPTNVKPKVPKLDNPLTDQELARLTQLDKMKKGVAEGNYDRDDYYNAHRGSEYGRDLTATGYGGDGSKTRRDDIFKGQSKRLPADPFARTSGAVPTAGTGRIHSTAQPDEMDEGDISQLEKDVADAPVAPIANMEGAKEKIGGRHDPADFDDMVNRLKKLAGAGPMKTVYDPNTRRYKNMPTAVQPRDKK